MLEDLDALERSDLLYMLLKCGETAAHSNHNLIRTYDQAEGLSADLVLASILCGIGINLIHWEHSEQNL